MHQKQPVLVVPIQIQFEKEYWGQKKINYDNYINKINSNDNYLSVLGNDKENVEPKRRRWSSWVNTHKGGQVVTETHTEYKEISSDDTNFSGGLLDPSSGAATEIKFSRFEGGDDFKSLSIRNPKKEATKTASSSSSSSDEDDGSSEDKFAEDALRVHNEMRKKHGVKSLKMSKKICAYAQEWADKLASEDRFDHRPDNPYGENLYCSWSSNPKAKISGDSPVQSWYSEMSKHTFGQEPRSMAAGHFTQVVWKGSKEFGIAKARSKSGKMIVVANYDPPGNFVGRYTENVLPPKA